MIPQPSLRLTAVFCASTLAVLGVLTETETTPENPDSGLPPEIVAAEADYEARQQALEKAFHQQHLRTLLLEPEARRDQLLGWLEENRAALEAQAARSEALDALYDRYQVVPLTERPEAQEAAHTSELSEHSVAPTNRLQALEMEAARLRAAYADDLEQRRDVMMAWEAAHGEEVRQLTLEAALAAGQDPLLSPPPTLAVAAESPAGATLLERKLAEANHRLALLHVTHPHPLRRVEGPPATPEELEAWRERMLELAAPLEAAREPLLRQIATLEQQRLIQYVHEYTR